VAVFVDVGCVCRRWQCLVVVEGVAAVVVEVLWRHCLMALLLSAFGYGVRSRFGCGVGLGVGLGLGHGQVWLEFGLRSRANYLSTAVPFRVHAD
jgi:hypothetical protein